MDDSAVEMIERADAFADFDRARDDLLGLYTTQVPDESLGFLPEGDEYTIGYVLMHVATVIKSYTAILEQIRGTAWGEVRLEEYPRPPLDIAVDKQAVIDEIETVHNNLAARLRELTPYQLEEKAPVYFPDTTEPYPTSGRDILGWLTDHYREHIPHVQSLLEGWRTSKSGA